MVPARCVHKLWYGSTMYLGLRVHCTGCLAIVVVLAVHVPVHFDEERSITELPVPGTPGTIVHTFLIILLMPYENVIQLLVVIYARFYNCT